LGSLSGEIIESSVDLDVDWTISSQEMLAAECVPNVHCKPPKAALRQHSLNRYRSAPQQQILESVLIECGSLNSFSAGAIAIEREWPMIGLINDG